MAVFLWRYPCRWGRVCLARTLFPTSTFQPQIMSPYHYMSTFDNMSTSGGIPGLQGSLPPPWPAPPLFRRRAPLSLARSLSFSRYRSLSLARRRLLSSALRRVFPPLFVRALSLFLSSALGSGTTLLQEQQVSRVAGLGFSRV